MRSANRWVVLLLAYLPAGCGEGAQTPSPEGLGRARTRLEGGAPGSVPSCALADNQEGHGLYFPFALPFEEGIYRQLRADAAEPQDPAGWCRARNFEDWCLDFAHLAPARRSSIQTLLKLSDSGWAWGTLPTPAQCQRAFADLKGKTDIQPACFSLRYGEPLEDLTPLTGLTGLTRLCTEFQGIRDLTPLSGLRRLEVVDLNITTIPVDDTTPLTVLPALRLARARGLDCGLLPQVATCESRVYPY